MVSLRKELEMSAILALLTALVLIIVGVARSKTPRKVPVPVLARRYLHQGHAWIRENEDMHIVVGMDDFSQTLIGRIDEVLLPRMLKFVRQGEVAWRVRHGARTIPILSPVTGWVIEKNENVWRSPELINDSPYSSGWLFKVFPVSLPAQLNNLMTSKTARAWLDLVQSRLSQFFSNAPVLLYQDGGVMMKDLCDRCSDEEWERLAKEIFLTPNSVG
jgi:glycine cleavage system H protein